MRLTIGLAAALAALPASAQDVAIDSAVYRESVTDGAVRIEPATRLMRGDRVVTILSWDAPRAGNFTVVSRVPAGLALQSASHPGLEVSTDGGRSWRRLADPDAVPRGTTHLRWQVGREGRLTYRAVVR
jgi:hypothetical protein